MKCLKWNNWTWTYGSLRFSISANATFILLNVSVSEDMPLYDILNEFQKGHSHMAVVIRQTNANYAAEPPANDGGTLGELQGNFLSQ